jgi:hypothetical protein
MGKKKENDSKQVVKQEETETGFGDKKLEGPNRPST